MNWIETYKQSHQNRTNRLLHSVGIPTVVLSLVVFFFSWRWGLFLFVIGWILQFVGHAFEGKAPAFFSNPLYLFVGPLWWIKKLFRKE
jgi:uncharacterized membrane protein YGL010W